MRSSEHTLLRRFEAAAAGEDREPHEHLALRVEQQVVAPVDHRPKRLLPGQCGPRPAGEQAKPIVEAFDQLGERQRAQAGGGELHRQWQAIEPAADVVDHPAVVVIDRRSRDGPPGHDRGTSSPRRRDRVHQPGQSTSPGTASASRLVATRRRSGTRLVNSLGQRRRLRDHVLAVVEHDDRAPISEMTHELIHDWLREALRFARGELADPQRGVHRGHHAVAVAHPCELDEPCAVAELGLQAARRLPQRDVSSPILRDR